MMAEIGNGYGSECHLLRFLGRHRRHMDCQVQKTVGADSIAWLDFHFDGTKRWPDGEWKGLDFLPPDPALAQKWRQFWPETGNPPNWDAVAQIRVQGQMEWLLVEAKANLEEIKSSCKASAKGGLGKIERALTSTKKTLGVPESSDWMSGYYQFCNRIAVLNFLTLNGVKAHLLFVYFLGDVGSSKRKCPRDQKEWESALRVQDCHVALPAKYLLSNRIHKLFLEVCPGQNRKRPPLPFR
jgi:hypothetical protein